MPYMRYDETPIHPVMQFWFGPMSMLGYLQQQFNSMPGTSNKAPSWQLKVGINAALNDMQNNHPNDLASLIYFSSSSGYGTARVNLTNTYSSLQNALFFPYPLLNSLNDPTATISPFLPVTPAYSNPAGLQANNDTIIPNSGTQTCPQSGFMVAYNQLSSATGYSGRRGAIKMVIFETDGVPNATASANLIQGTGGYCYDTPGNITFYGDSTELHVPPKDNAISVVQQIVASTTPIHRATRLRGTMHWFMPLPSAKSLNPPWPRRCKPQHFSSWLRCRSLAIPHPRLPGAGITTI